MYNMVADQCRNTKLQIRFKKCIIIALGKSWRDEEEETIILNIIFIQMKDLLC